MTDEQTRRCARCGAVALPADRHCEACGELLTGESAVANSAEQCPSCGGTDVDPDGYCQSCGLRRDGSRPGARYEVDLGPVAGVSDRGLVHRDNEDGMGLAVIPGPDGPPALPGPPALLAVVCDGVSSVPGSGPAAQAGARAATAELSQRLADVLAGSDPAGDQVAGNEMAGDEMAGDEVAGAILAAAAVAQQAVAAFADQDAAPSCTFVAAAVVVRKGGFGAGGSSDDAAAGELTIGWLGDSRVYLFGPDGPRRLTTDDTLSAQAARDGLIPESAAETGIGSHTITRWLGADSEHVVPQIASTPLAGPARIVVCSDGLWNYASEPAVLAAHVADLPADASPLAVARHLTDMAVRAGGRDNITTVVLDIPGSA